MSEKVIAFLPCRKGSERVKAKNIRTFAGIEGGLTVIKLKQLVSCSDIDEITVSTDDPVVLALAEEAAHKTDKPIHVKKRPPDLARSNTSTDELIRYVPEIIGQGIVLWTHVTSPFVDEKIYMNAISMFRQQSRYRKYDSLMSVTTIQTFLWDGDRPLNYDRTKEKWPRTQTLPKYYEVNSAIFLAAIDTYRSEGDRIGRNPFLFELGFPASVDLDTEKQFSFAEWLWSYEKKD